MKPLETVGRVTRDGLDLALYHRDGAFQIRVDGMELMSSQAHGSEDALAELAQEAILGVKAPRVLVGGLGMGFTLRAALDRFPRRAELVVAEVFPEVVVWNRGPLAHLAARPLEDPRVRVVESDVSALLGKTPFDCILLDVDNGPTAFSLPSNAGLYDAVGIARICRSLKDGGVLALWSADLDPAFERRLQRAGMETRRERPRARGRAGGPRHAIYLARREGPCLERRKAGVRRKPRRRRR